MKFTQAWTAYDVKSAWTVGANVMWQPVKQMRMGWEVNYAEWETFNNQDFDDLQPIWGTWFFF